MNKRLQIGLETLLEDWSMMQKTKDDEGADWAERFEMHFYEFINELKNWYRQLQHPPKTTDELEEHSDIQNIIEQLPAPLELNFLTELELIVDGEDQVRYD